MKVQSFRGARGSYVSMGVIGPTISHHLGPTISHYAHPC